MSLELIGLGYAADFSTIFEKPTETKATKQQPQLEHLAREFEEPTLISTKVRPKQGKYMILNVGKSHKIFHYVAPVGCDLVALRPNTNSMTASVAILIFGISRSIVGQTAAEISRYKKPNRYSTKGISNPLNPSVTKSRS